MFGTNAGDVQTMARLIQLAVAPIFLLSAVATTLLLLLGRLSRIVDRGRQVESRAPATPGTPRELRTLERRAHLIYRAISLGVFAAILVCMLMTAAFIGEMFSFNAAPAVAVCFIAALFAYTGALLFLLREVFLAIAHLRFGAHPPKEEKA